ncbi:4Fe-4S dicluster domain-containing protein [Pseudodesulfovibrio cashew]|uniref:4Fe-4S dicluster domain-containing protein n=1 Tax=Pseudodesulfovibrio cashew TaxID=2678688 RepID=A0A6I6JHA8_9BACT|nr:ATP-binding protein [Pseudodesulfovibrio cashew]QGY39467.1 4Fe-4S dicluster domain-containing protein [Pseudodesulfovibrio cashew]
MIFAIASGKGGTGKTTVSASLATLWENDVTAVDLDVEEPNLHLFLNPEITGTEKGYVTVPEADEERCVKCGACRDICQFKAITLMAGTLLVFPEMCHGCGGCMAVCPEKALIPGRRELGEIVRGRSGNMEFLMGRLRIGEAMAPPLMRQVKERMGFIATGDVIIDAPPGVSCPAMNAVMDADAVVLVTEPTPFGFHDFKLAWEAFSPLGIPMGAVINRAGLGDSTVQNFCKEKGIPIWAEIPYDRAIAEAYSQGRVIADAVPGLRDTFLKLKEHMVAAAEENDMLGVFRA